MPRILTVRLLKIRLIRHCIMLPVEDIRLYMWHRRDWRQDGFLIL